MEKETARREDCTAVAAAGTDGADAKERRRREDVVAEEYTEMLELELAYCTIDSFSELPAERELIFAQNDVPRTFRSCSEAVRVGKQTDPEEDSLLTTTEETLIESVTMK